MLDSRVRRHVQRNFADACDTIISAVRVPGTLMMEDKLDAFSTRYTIVLYTMYTGHR